MNQICSKNKNALLEKANSLPLCPGVYIMKNSGGNIIYVGKSRKLKNRVTSYFREGDKNLKTIRMVNSVEDFDYVVCSTETEALALENVLIKKHMPRYNIKLKDAKSYPYIKVDVQSEYPRLTFTRKREADRAKYFGPYASGTAIREIIGLLEKTLGLASCKRQFPRDIGRERPCIYAQMHRCIAPCTGKVPPAEYRELVNEAVKILGGNIGGARRSLEKKMTAYAEEERFEEAARCRDIIKALGELLEKQQAVGAPEDEYDVFALASGEKCSVISYIAVRGGAIINKMDYVFGENEILAEDNAASFLYEFYSDVSDIPREVLLSFSLEEGEYSALSEYASAKAGRKILFRTPERGSGRALTRTAENNAREKLRQSDEKTEEKDKTLSTLAFLLGLEVLPERIEAYDISNWGTEHATAGMIVWEKGKFIKRDYRVFKIGESVRDDYAAMREAISRRAEHIRSGDTGFGKAPDLILADGGATHAQAAREALREKGVDIPVFGMVKDSHHKTRALTAGGADIGIAREPSVFRLIYAIQEEVHRFALSRMSAAKRKTVKKSALEDIKGIGRVKAKKIIDAAGSWRALAKATEEELVSKGISEKDAKAIVLYFSEKRGAVK